MNPKKSAITLLSNDMTQQNQHSATDPLSSLSLLLKERLRQARLSFNSALCMTVFTTAISFVGVTLMMAGQRSEGAITAVGGGASTACLLKLAKDANDRLDKFASELDDKTS